MNAGALDLAILVALPEEFEQLLSQLYGSLDILRDHEYGNYYYRFLLAPETRAPTQAVACFIGGMGPDRAGRQMERLLQRWSPRVTTVVGICGAIHQDVCLGDVVVPNRVDAYLSTTKAIAASGGDLHFEHRGIEYECDHELVEEVRNLRFAHKPDYERWQSESSATASQLLAGHVDDLARRGLWRHRPRIHTGRMASGPVVSAAASFRAWLCERSSECTAIEMEAAGVAAAAAERVSRLRFIAIRGVSDLADGRKSSFDGVRSGSIRTCAMSNALGLLGTLAALGAFTVDNSRARRAPLIPKHLHHTGAGLDRNEVLARSITDWMLRDLASGRNLSGIRVLLADDERAIRQGCSDVLSRLGAQAVCANDGSDALEYLRRGPDFDIVLTDLRMGHIGGYELARKIAEEWPNMPVIFMSGYGRATEAADNCVAFLEKPFLLEELASVVADVHGDKLREALLQSLPELRRWFNLLFDCRRRVVSFMRDSSGAGLFETAFRHKLKDSVATFARAVANGANPKLEVDKLSHEVRKLGTLLRGAQVGRPPNLMQFVGTLTDDIRKQLKGVHIAADVDPDVITHLEPAAAVFLCVAALELVDNATEALNGKGSIRVTFSCLPLRQQVFLQVWSPTGPLDDSLAERIFEEGYSTKGPERGMGLSILRDLAERFDGRLWLTQNDGVEFCMALPYSQPKSHVSTRE